jgi:AhpD family alkylhydroperoxidase
VTGRSSRSITLVIADALVGHDKTARAFIRRFLLAGIFCLAAIIVRWQSLVTSMSEHNHEVLNDLNPQARALRQMIPEVYRGYVGMSTAVLSSGALDRKVKELMAMAIGVVDRCDGCIAAHARGAVLAGASKEEAAEAIGVSILMQGGPATVYGARAYDAFCEFADAHVTV